MSQRKICGGAGGFLLSAFRDKTLAEDPALVTTTTVNLFVFAGIREKLGGREESGESRPMAGEKRLRGISSSRINN